MHAFDVSRFHSTIFLRMDGVVSLRLSGGVLQRNPIQERDPCVIAAARAIETIVEDPLLPILKEDSNITKSTGQVRRPGLDHNPASPRSKLLMIDFIPHPKVGAFFNVRLSYRRTLCPFLRKKFVQSFFSWGKYIPFASFPQAEFRGGKHLLLHDEN
jgi:hypothetical protein